MSESAFGIDHGDISKGLKPQHVESLKRVAARPWILSSAQKDYAQARLSRHGIKDVAGSPEIAQRMTSSRRMFKNNEESALRLNNSLQTNHRRGKTGMRVMEGPKIKYGRSKGHLRLVKSSS